MVAKCIIGVCIAFICAAPVFGDEGKSIQSGMLAKFFEPNQPLQKHHEALPQVKVREDYQYYEINGTTPDELRAKMKRNGTAWDDGKVYAALTTWDIRYHYNISASNGRYALSAITTDVDIVFHFPKLMPSATTPEQLVMSWNTYLENLKTHEFGHRDIAVGIGQEIYRTLSSLGSCSSEKELDHQAQSLIKEKFQRLKEVQVEYDQETRHGKKQGAILMDPMVAASVPAT